MGLGLGVGLGLGLLGVERHQERCRPASSTGCGTPGGLLNVQRSARRSACEQQPHQTCVGCTVPGVGVGVGVGVHGVGRYGGKWR